MKATPHPKRKQKVIPALSVRQMNADMALKCLSLGEVAEAAGLNYHVASALLGGRRVVPEQLARLREAIDRFPTPEPAL